MSEEAAPRRGFRWSHLLLGVLLVALVGGAFWLKATGTPVRRGNTGGTTLGATAGESTQALLARGIREHNAGANDAAMEIYHRVLQREPGHAQAHYNLGQIYNTRGEYAKAQWEYEATLKGEPESVNARLNLGVVLHRQGQFASAPARLVGDGLGWIIQATLTPALSLTREREPAMPPSCHATLSPVEGERAREAAMSLHPAV